MKPATGVIGGALMICMAIASAPAALATWQNEPVPTVDPVVEADETVLLETGGDPGAGGVILGAFSADYSGPTKKSDLPIPVIKASARAGVHSAFDRPCYQFADASAGVGSDPDAPELSREDRFDQGGATDAENLAVINEIRSQQASEPSRRVGRSAFQTADNGAIFEIFAREAALNNPTAGAVPGSGAGQCLIEYYCGAERVDDVVSGHIDSEPDGAFAEYVNGVAIWLDKSTADIRLVESSPPADGAAAPQIPVPSSLESQRSLATALAERGLDTSPGELFMPVFNFCRQGDGGTIETAIDGPYAVSFGWTRLDEEFDIPGSSQLVFDGVKRQLLGEPPQMRTIPPIDEGVTIVKFPMWLWLDEPFPGAAFEQISQGNHIRMRGRATLEHVVWSLGDTEIVCELDDMKEFLFDSDMSPADKPACSHTFFELIDYTMTAEVVYRIEQQLSYRRSPNGVWPDAPWEPHPIQAFVPVSSTTGQMSVEEIYSFNTPINEPSDG